MAEYGIPYELDTPLGTISFNPTGSQVDGYYLTDVAGLDEPALRVNVDNRPQLDGGILYDSWLGPRYPILTGELRYLTVGFGAPSGRRAAEDTLRACLRSIVRADGTLRFTPTGGSERALTVRHEGLQIGNEQGPLKTFQIALVAADPTIVDTTAQSDNSSALSTSGLTKWLFPFSFPFTFGARSTGGTMVIENAGNQPAYPVFTLSGACTSPVITNQESNLQISLPTLALGDADTAVIDCYAQTVLVNGVQGIQYLDQTVSAFFAIDPQVSTTVRLSAQTFDSGANLAIDFSNTWA